MRGKELHRLVHAHPQHLPDRLPAHLHRQRLGIEPRSPARLAQHLHVRQEAHLDGLDALALARGAAPGIRRRLAAPLALRLAAARVEGEPARGVAADARFLRIREQLPDRVEEAHVGRGARARRLADGRLVHLQHARHALPAGNRLAAEHGRSGLPIPRRPHQPLQVLPQHVARERGLARARHTRHHREAPQRKAHGDVLEVVQVRAWRPRWTASSGSPAAAAARGASAAREGTCP